MERKEALKDYQLLSLEPPSTLQQRGNSWLSREKDCSAFIHPNSAGVRGQPKDPAKVCAQPKGFHADPHLFASPFKQTPEPH